MSFLSVPFWLFLAAVASVYYSVSVKGQNRLLILANFAFLASWGWAPPLLHFGIACIGFYSLRLGKRWFWVCPAAIVGVLVYCKYRVFADAGFLMPLGLSFYSFQILGYMWECRLGRTPPSDRLWTFLLFTSFFPLILMGPIERHRHLAPQFSLRRHLTGRKSAEAFFLIALGLFKKMAIADALSNYVELGLHDGGGRGAGLLLFCVLAFFQIFADFSGYIDLARGIAKLLGIDLVENFNQPYLATSINDVWQRWNITLISWLRDFVYMPMMLFSKNIYLASGVVFLLVGLWHNVTLGYLLWSVYWIAIFWIYLFLRQHRILPRRSKKGVWLGRLVTFLMLCLSSLAFVAKTPADFPAAFVRLFEFAPVGGDFWSNSHLEPKTAIFLAPALAIMIAFESLYFRWIREESLGRNSARLVMLGYLLVLASTILGTSAAKNFIYLQY